MSSGAGTLISPFSPPLYFEGGGKKEQKARAKAVRETLESAGIDRETLADEWGVTLWRAFFKGNRAVLTVDTGKKTDFKGLEKWLSARLKDAGFSNVRVIDRSMKKCCEKACKSCLNGNKEARKDWTA